MADTHDLLSQINKRFDTLEQGQKRLEQGQKNLEQGQTQTNKRLSKLEDGQAQTNTSLGQINTVLKALEAGQEATKSELKVDIHDLKVDLVKKVKNHESRIENVEEHTGTHNPHKN